jgi:hypothetical protein
LVAWSTPFDELVHFRAGKIAKFALTKIENRVKNASYPAISGIKTHGSEIKTPAFTPLLALFANVGNTSAYRWD